MNGIREMRWFQARAVAGQALAASTYAGVLLGAEDYDEPGAHSTTSDTARFYCRTAVEHEGPHLAWGSVLWPAGAATTAGTTTRAARVVKNGTIIPAATSYATYAGNNLTIVTPPVFVDLKVGDYLELQAYSDLAGSLYGAGDEGSALRVLGFGRTA